MFVRIECVCMNEQHFAGIGTLAYCGNYQACRRSCFEIFVRVDSDINTSCEQGLFNFFREKTLAFYLIETQVLNGIAFCFDDFDNGVDSDVLQLALHEMSLP